MNYDPIRRPFGDASQRSRLDASDYGPIVEPHDYDERLKGMTEEIAALRENVEVPVPGARVFIPSVRYKKRADGSYQPIVDLFPATHFGELVHLTTPGNAFVSQFAVNEVANKIADAKPTDYLLAIGDITLFGVALAQMHIKNGLVRVLRWDGRDECYVVEKIEWDDGLETED